jgi:hypothetical protein
MDYTFLDNIYMYENFIHMGRENIFNLSNAWENIQQFNFNSLLLHQNEILPIQKLVLIKK